MRDADRVLQRRKECQLVRSSTGRRVCSALSIRLIRG